LDEAVISVGRAKLAEQPGGKALANLPNGARVTVRGGPAAWVEVEHQGMLGVVSRRSLSFVEVEHSGLESVPARPPIPPKAKPADIKISGIKVLGPDGIRFGTKFKLGLYNYGLTSLRNFFEQDPDAFPTLSPSIARVMQAVSDNEGKIEAINSWDDAILSCSIYQWTSGVGVAQGELPYALSLLKADAPSSFQTFFGDEGLDVMVEAGAVTGFFVLGGERLDTAAKKAELRRSIWAYRFWRAAHDRDVRRAYVKAAIARIGRFYPVKIAALGNRPMSDYISSEVGVAQLLDQHVNRPGHLSKTVVNAVKAYVAEKGASNPAQWSDKDERAMLKLYIKQRGRTNMTDSDKRAARVNSYVASGLISDKRGSFRSQ